jgi:hypothetical protein
MIIISYVLSFVAKDGSDFKTVSALKDVIWTEHMEKFHDNLWF